VDLAARRRLVIGRSPHCDLRLSAASVSRRHALLFEHAGAWHLVDLGSRGGVYQGAERVHHAILADGAWTRVGPMYLWLAQDPARPTRSVGQPDPAWSMVDEGQPGELRLVVADARAPALRRRSLADCDFLAVGRSSRCHIDLSDSRVSRLHCVLYRERRGWYVVAVQRGRATSVAGAGVVRRRLVPDRHVLIGHSMLWLETVPGGGEGRDRPAGELALSPLPGEIAPVTASAFFDDPKDLLDPSPDAADPSQVQVPQPPRVGNGPPPCENPGSRGPGPGRGEGTLGHDGAPCLRPQGRLAPSVRPG
jgi:pSer/pThr/pTyr-binding forkhead associated (FHA) protein